MGGSYYPKSSSIMKGSKSLDEIHRGDGWLTLSQKQLNNEIGKGGSYCPKSSSIMKGPKSLDEIHRDDGWFTLSHKQLNNEIGKGGSYCPKSSSIMKGSKLIWNSRGWRVAQWLTLSQNNLNFRLKTLPVKVAADATEQAFTIVIQSGFWSWL